ncbi:MAG: winged helix-turn-helix transcriptional regulator [Chthoniobacterales bacterium]|nr:winged helix-turn-helix transcriptional regulator [Chthoniobacterales bacterium]
MSDAISKKQVAAWQQMLMAQSRIVRLIEQQFQMQKLVPFTHYDILLQLRYAPERQMRFREITGEIVLSKSALSRCIDRMASAGLVEKLDCPHDPRGLVVRLTSEGENELKKAWPVYRKQIECLFGTHFSERELDFLAKRFAKISRQPRSELK